MNSKSFLKTSSRTYILFAAAFTGNQINFAFGIKSSGLAFSSMISKISGNY